MTQLNDIVWPSSRAFSGPGSSSDPGWVTWGFGGSTALSTWNFFKNLQSPVKGWQDGLKKRTWYRSRCYQAPPDSRASRCKRLTIALSGNASFPDLYPSSPEIKLSGVTDWKTKSQARRWWGRFKELRAELQNKRLRPLRPSAYSEL